jgi:cytoskeletal protein CcmA (bactofilin family)
MPFLTDDISINTLIGTGSSVSGDIRINGFLRVDGDIDGNLETPNNVIIGEKARIHGNITAASAVIGGVVMGNILAPDSITLLSTAAVIGNVTTHKLQVEDKVVLHGHCIALKKDEDYEAAVKNALPIPALHTKGK